MNQNVRQKWVKALRSGKYKQTQTKLKKHNDNSFCCLGVLCELHRKLVMKKGTSKVWKKSEQIENGDDYLNTHSILPKKVMEWAGLAGNNPTLCYNGRIASLAGLNDDGYTFNEIANLIEKEL